jgi:hypothetical protein
MEGKAVLFKYLGGVDAFPLCLATKDPDDIIQACEWLEPSFGGINRAPSNGICVGSPMARVERVASVRRGAGPTSASPCLAPIQD